MALILLFSLSCCLPARADDITTSRELVFPSILCGKMRGLCDPFNKYAPF